MEITTEICSICKTPTNSIVHRVQEDSVCKPVCAKCFHWAITHADDIVKPKNKFEELMATMIDYTLGIHKEAKKELPNEKVLELDNPIHMDNQNHRDSDSRTDSPVIDTVISNLIVNFKF